MIEQLGIRQKILTLCVTIALGILMIGGVGYFALDRVMRNYTELSEVILPSTTHLALMRAMGRELLAMMASLNMSGNSDEETKRLRTRATESMDKFKKLFAEYSAGMTFAEEKAKLPELQRIFEKQLLVNAEMLAAFDAGTADSRKQFSNLYQTRGKEARIELFKAIDDMIDLQRNESVRWREQAASTAVAARLWLISLVIAGFTLSVLAGLFFSSSLSRLLVSVSEGLRGAAAQVAGDSARIYRASESLSASATEQAAAIQETSSSMHELSSIVGRNTENFQRALDSSEKSGRAVAEGKSVVQKVIRSMGDIEVGNTEIHRQVNDSNQRISEIVHLIKEIGAKTKIINDIVFQTKLLSFNASVEAARAGEHGKGFAVVAEEVGQLAANSGKASQEIASMLEDSIQKVERIVSDSTSKVEALITQATDRIREGSGVAARCGEVLDQIVQNVQEVQQMSSEVSTASREQSKGVEEINRAIIQLDKVTQANAAAAANASATAQSLDDQSTLMSRLVSRLTQAVMGSRSAVADHNLARVDSRSGSPSGPMAGSVTATQRPSEREQLVTRRRAS